MTKNYNIESSLSCSQRKTLVKMSTFDLIKAGLSAIFAEVDISGRDGIPFRNTSIMGPPVIDSD